MMIKRIMLFCFVMIAMNLDAQKLHFTQFGMAPLTVNPALTGSFNGTARVTGILRDQYFGSSQSALKGTYVNLGLGVEWNAMRGIGEYDWISVGVNLGNHSETIDALSADALGSANLANQVMNMSLAYHLGMGKKGSSALSIGLQYGNFGRTVKSSENFVIRGTTPIGSFFTSGGGGGGGGGTSEPSINYGDIAAGVTYTTKGKTSLFRTGLSFTHILGGDQSFASRGRDDKALGFIGFIQSESSMNKTTTFKPALIFQRDGHFQQIEAQARFGYLFNPEKEITLNYGLGYRVGESAQLLLGVDYGQLQAGLSYDFVLGGLRDAARETIELGFAYVFNVEKKPERVPSVFCPRL